MEIKTVADLVSFANGLGGKLIEGSLKPMDQVKILAEDGYVYNISSTQIESYKDVPGERTIWLKVVES